jgi:hypothetical protein
LVAALAGGGIRAIFVAAILTLLPAIAHAQSLWLPRDTGSLMRLEGYRPSLANTPFESFSSGWFLTGQWPFRDGMDVVVEVPFGYGQRERFLGEERSFDFGGPYLGARWSDAEGAFADFGVRLPLGQSDLGAAVGMLAELERVGAFFGDAGALRARGGRGAAVAGGLILEPSAGFTFIMADGGTVTYGQYGVVLRRHARSLFWSAGATGLLLIDSGGDLGSRTFHHAGAAVGRAFGPVRAAMIVQAPIAEEHAVDWIAGMSLQARLW